MVYRPKTGTKKLWTSRIALRDIPGDLYLSCTWYTPILKNGETVLTAQHYDLLPQQVSDLTTEVNAKYLVSVIELQREGNHYCLSKDNLTVITSYIKETAAAFAPDVEASQAASKKVSTATKRKTNASVSSSSSTSNASSSEATPTFGPAYKSNARDRSKKSRIDTTV